MSTFDVKSPDGRTFRVTAPDGASQEEVLARVQAQASKPSRQLPKPPPSVKKRSVLETAGDFLGDVVDNITPNWGDEIAAANAVSRTNVLNPANWPAAAAIVGARIGRGDDVGGEFRKAQKAFKDSQTQYDQEHNKLAWGSTIAGTVAGLALPGGAAAKGASWGVKARQGAKVGAAYGALAGGGNGEGLADRAENALEGAGVGAMGGAVLAKVAHHAPAAWRAAKRIPGVAAAARALPNIPRAVMGLPRRTRQDDIDQAANRMAAARMSEGHIDHGFGTPGPQASPEAVAAELERRRTMGVPAMAGDVSEPLRGLSRWASSGVGRGQAMVRDALNRRQADAAVRARQHVIDTMGDVTDPQVQVESITQRAKAAASPLYREAYAQPMVITPEIEGIMQTPAFREALPHALRNIRNAQRNPEELGFRLHPDGSIEGAETLTVEGFDQVIRAMRDNGRSAMNHSGFRPVDTTDSVHINNRARDLKQALGEQNQPYAEVNARYADDMTQRDAFQAGQGIADLTGPEVSAWGRHNPENAQASWSLGARSALADEASQWGNKYPTGNVADQVRRSLGDAPKQEAVGQLMGNNGAVRNLGDRLEAENQAHKTWRDVYGNSQSWPREAADASMDEMVAAVPTSLSGRGLVVGFVNHLASLANSKHKQAVKDRIAQIVTAESPQDVQELMGAIRRQAENDAGFMRLLDRSGILAAKEYAREIGPED